MGGHVPDVVAADELACAVFLGGRGLLWFLCNGILLQGSGETVVIIATIPSLVHLGHEVATRRRDIRSLLVGLWKVLQDTEEIAWG
jgi:hypothetical protein